MGVDTWGLVRYDAGILHGGRSDRPDHLFLSWLAFG